MKNGVYRYAVKTEKTRGMEWVSVENTCASPRAEDLRHAVNSQSVLTARLQFHEKSEGAQHFPKQAAVNFPFLIGTYITILPMKMSTGAISETNAGK